MSEPKASAASPANDAKWNAAAIAALMTCEGDHQPTRMGAGLFLAHLNVERGAAKVRAMSTQELRDAPGEMMRRMPMIAPSLLSGHAAGFVNVLGMYGREHESVEHYEREIVRLAPVAPIAGWPIPERAATA